MEGLAVDKCRNIHLTELLATPELTTAPNDISREGHTPPLPARFEGAATRLYERERILADLGDRRVPALRNHGLLLEGELHLTGAFHLVGRDERLADTAPNRQSGAAFFPMPDAVAASALSARGH